MRKPKASQLAISWWRERDRASVVVTDTKTNKDISEWWDEEVSSMIGDGWFRWENDASVIEYLIDIGIAQ